MEKFQDLLTAFEAETITTSSPEQYVGHTLAAPCADFPVGTILTNDNLVRIKFFLEEGSVTEVVLSSQIRAGHLPEIGFPKSYLYSVTTATGKVVKVFMRASSVAMARAIGQDFCEQVLTDTFFEDSVKRVNLTWAPPTEDKEASFYQVNVSVRYEGDSRPRQIRYLTYARDIDEASAIVSDYRKVELLTVDNPPVELNSKASPFNVQYIVPDRFFEVYKQHMNA